MCQKRVTNPSTKKNHYSEPLETESFRPNQPMCNVLASYVWNKLDFKPSAPLELVKTITTNILLWEQISVWLSSFPAFVWRDRKKDKRRWETCEVINSRCDGRTVVDVSWIWDKNVSKNTHQMSSLLTAFCPVSRCGRSRGDRGHCTIFLLLPFNSQITCNTVLFYLRNI